MYIFKSLRPLLCVVLAGLLSLVVYAQDTTGIHARKWEDHYVSAVNTKAEAFNSHIEKYTEKSLDRVIRQEKKMQAKVAKIDAVKAKALFTYSIDSLQQLKTLMQRKTGIIGRYLGKNYFPYLDTLKQSLGFLRTAHGGLDAAGQLQGKLTASEEEANQVEGKLATADKINEYLRQRELVLQSQLSSFPGLSSNLRTICKESWYYQAQVSEYKNTLQDEEKMEKLALGVLQKIPAFQQFVGQNSQLSGLFASPAGFPGSGGSSIPVVNGLPSRAAVQQAIQAVMPSSGPNAMQMIQQQIGGAGAGSGLDDLTNRLSGLGGTSGVNGVNGLSGVNGMNGLNGGNGMNGVNTQRVKSFRKRLETGFDLQFGSSTNFLPASTSIGLRVGYKLNDKSSAGVGVAYTMGMGTGWNHIRFSNESVGFRSYLRWKLKGSLSMQGGGEWNYLTQFGSIAALRNYNAWQTSALLGLSKKYKISSKRSGELQLLYDFLYRQHVPASQPLLFRMGYNF